MEYIKVSQAAEKWGLSPRRVRLLCAQNRIDGVVQKGKLYMIPENAPKPVDARTLGVFRKIPVTVMRAYAEPFQPYMIEPKMTELLAENKKRKNYAAAAPNQLLDFIHTIIRIYECFLENTLSWVFIRIMQRI